MDNTVELIGTYGGDLEHALSAWTSTSRELTDEKRARIPQLLKYLAENGHHTPFEKSKLHFLVDVETASHIHTIKHRVGVEVNGESARYKELQTRHYAPDDWPHDWQARLNAFAAEGEKLYREALDDLEVTYGFTRKRAKESARFFLTFANQNRLDVAFNFRSFMHFCGLRHKPDAQKEIHDIADKMLQLVGATRNFNHSLEAFGYEQYVNAQRPYLEL